MQKPKGFSHFDRKRKETGMGEPSNLLVVCLGMGTVFFGLICIVLICSIMSALCRAFEKKETAKPEESSIIANKQEIVAACCAVIAEEIGTEAKNIKVVSFKKI